MTEQQKEYQTDTEYQIAHRVVVSSCDTGSMFNDCCLELDAINDDKENVVKIYIHKDNVEKLIKDITEVYQKYIV